MLHASHTTFYTKSTVWFRTSLITQYFKKWATISMHLLQTGGISHHPNSVTYSDEIVAHAYRGAWRNCAGLIASTCHWRADVCAGHRESHQARSSSSGRDSPVPSTASTPSCQHSFSLGTCSLDKRRQLSPSWSPSTACLPWLRSTDGRTPASVRSNCVTWSMRPNCRSVANWTFKSASKTPGVHHDVTAC